MAAGLLVMSLPCYCVSYGAVIYTQERIQSTESFRLEEFSWNLLTFTRDQTILLLSKISVVFGNL